ncbi:MAG: divalent cation tolerance protein CutA [Colwellia sp.]
MYCWQDELHCDSEVQLLIKTDESKFAILNDRINI